MDVEGAGIPVAHRFFSQRESIEDKTDLGFEDIPGLLEYANLPRTIGAVVSSQLATLHECQTIYSVEDVYLMLEVISIDAHNQRAAVEWEKRQRD
jgi:hypothetical protein